MQRRLLARVDGLADWGEVRVLEQRSAIPTEPLDVLVIGLLQATLETSVHSPVPDVKDPDLFTI